MTAKFHCLAAALVVAFLSASVGAQDGGDGGGGGDGGDGAESVPAGFTPGPAPNVPQGRDQTAGIPVTDLEAIFIMLGVPPQHLHEPLDILPPPPPTTPLPYPEDETLRGWVNVEMPDLNASPPPAPEALEPTNIGGDAVL
jgi:hypothetical protein